MRTATWKILEDTTLSDEQSRLHAVKFEVTYSDGKSFTPTHEQYEMGDAAAVLLYNTEQRTVVLTRQFRLPAALTGVPYGMLLEACAGKLDGKTAEETARHEAKEELGFTLREITRVMGVYSTPGSVVEKLDLFIAPYTPDMKTEEGGGLDEEKEHTEVVELSFDEAYGMIRTGEIVDAKTVILLQHLRLAALF
jgi:nudix-type nucleoside diphosphatase (YffH/AdpP family)